MIELIKKHFLVQNLFLWYKIEMEAVKCDFTNEVSLPMVNQEQLLPTTRKRKKQQTIDEDPIDWTAPM